MGYKKLFWGFIFMFDFRIGNLDILPDIIGYILFYIALNYLEDRNTYFGNAKKFALPMIFVSIFDIYQVSIPIQELGNEPLGFFAIIIGSIIAIVNLFMVYNICKGIAREADKIQDYDLSAKATFRWKLYLANSIILLTGILIPPILAIFLIFIVIFAIVTYLLMLGLMRTSAERLEIY